MVNFAFKLNKIPDESVSPENPRDELLRRVKRLAPRVVTVVEQEINGNTAPFLARVAETLSYYGALLESIEATTVGKDNSINNSDRVRLEEGLSRKLHNSVACEGRDRVERCEVFGKWRARMSMAGFELKPLSQSMVESIKARLISANNRVNSGLTVKEENGGICFGWMGRTLTVASAWR
ncbi:Scarecrow-like protein 8 [Glycine soja]|nr:Scarecrow-like protein 8 [Glycine soja]